MASVAVETSCGIVILVGFILNVVAFVNPAWEKSDLERLFSKTDVKFNGLWQECKANADGKTTCEFYDAFFLGLEPKLQAARGFSTFSLILCLAAFGACFATVSGYPCASENGRTRNRMRKIAGGIGVIAGVSMIVGVSWFAAETHREYESLKHFNIELFVFGEAIFIGLVGGSVILIGGLLALCVSCGYDDDEGVARPRYLPATASLPMKEYV